MEFERFEKRSKLRYRVENEKPLLLIGSPPCTAFSQLLMSNVTKMNPTDLREKIREGMQHLLFCVELYKIQIQNNRYFLHEHPWGAWSWKIPEIVSLLQTPSVEAVKGHMCTQGMYIHDDKGEALAFKPTGWMSNSPCILEQLNRQCTNLSNNPEHYHRHADLQCSRASKAAIYPEQLCYSILRDLRAQMKSLGLEDDNSIGSICEDRDEHEFLQELQHLSLIHI